ncbi:MAG: hypothetical protein DMF89_20950 [Acidobacteria bacterium]|nr:MAG: hypothetical protein DMF90_15990 [Acidobacteriota bacterium]PYR46768.1 MAG: hypothetical protein DMF89_20950 [Acidobacteriota bacterium]
MNAHFPVEKAYTLKQRQSVAPIARLGTFDEWRLQTLGPPGQRSIGVFILRCLLTDPIRGVLPEVGGLDFSPMVLLIALRVLRGLN